MRLSGRQTLALFGIGALGGLIGDACHVYAGTTEYLKDDIPFIWKSQFWFPIAVGLATVATGEVRLRLAPPRPGGDLNEGIAAISSVIAIYALTAVVTDEATGAATVLIWALAFLVYARFGDGRPALICAVTAAILGPAAEILLVETDVAAYSPAADGLFGVVAARLAELIPR